VYNVVARAADYVIVAFHTGDCVVAVTTVNNVFAIKPPSPFVAIVSPDIVKPGRRLQKRGAGFAFLSLTPREMEVMKFLCEGRSNFKIAERLAISTRTTKLHVKNVIERLIVADRKQAAERIAELGVLPDEW
jgi:DNA-binding NarL/FixJ family response regulator